MLHQRSHQSEMTAEHREEMDALETMTAIHPLLLQTGFVDVKHNVIMQKAMYIH